MIVIIFWTSRGPDDPVIPSSESNPCHDEKKTFRNNSDTAMEFKAVWTFVESVNGFFNTQQTSYFDIAWSQLYMLASW